MVSILRKMGFSGLIDWLQKSENAEIVYPVIIGGLIMVMKIWSQVLTRFVVFILDFLVCSIYNVLVLIFKQLKISYRRQFPENVQLNK